MTSDPEDTLFNILIMDVRKLDLSVRILNSILSTGSNTLYELFSIADLQQRYNTFGRKSLEEIRAFMAEFGLDETYVIDDPMIIKYYLWKEKQHIKPNLKIVYSRKY